MKRASFLKALAGLGVGAVVVPKMKDEEEFTVTSEDGRMAWDQDGSQVYADKTLYAVGDVVDINEQGSIVYWNGTHWIPALP